MATITEDRVLEALSALVPEETRDKVTAVVTSLLDEAVGSIKEKLMSEYNGKLDEGYRIIAEEREKDWQTAEQGYKQALDIIYDLRARLEKQNEEFQATLVEEYEKAYQMILAERQKNEELETTLYEEFNKRTEAIKEYIVEKCDDFLGEMGDEYYEAARREVLQDPCLAEHRIAFERVLDVAKDYLSDEDIMLNTTGKVDGLETQVESLNLQKRQIEGKCMRLMTENNKMHDYLKETKELVEKNMLNEQNERLSQARKVQGRGDAVVEPEREVLLGEVADRSAVTDKGINSDDPQTITEQWQVLAGIREND
jgi:hypothetical protein